MFFFVSLLRYFFLISSYLVYFCTRGGRERILNIIQLINFTYFYQDWVQVQTTVPKTKSKYLDIFQVQVQSLCYVLKSKSNYMALFLIKYKYKYKVKEWRVECDRK